jgi:hypothetical protein
LTILSRALGVATGRRSLSLDDWANYFNYGGLNYPFASPSQTLTGKVEDLNPTFEGYVQGAYKTNGVVFACMLARLALFSEARFQFRRIRQGRPGEMYGTRALDVLEKPWRNGHTGDLLKRMVQDADLAGNFFGTRTVEGGLPALKRQRPDWMTIVVGSEMDVDDPSQAIDAELVGYLYHPGGPAARKDPIALLPEHVVHFAPIPDPTFRFRGMSWLDPIIAEIVADKAAMSHKRKFFENGATPNMVVNVDPKVKDEAFERWVAKFKKGQEGVDKAYKTLFLGGGTTAQVVGANMRQIDFKTTQGSGETRIAAAAGVPPIIVGLSEGLESATYSNYGQARRRFADGTMRPLWRDAAHSLATVIDVPSDSELWYDDRDIPFLQEDVQDEATIQSANASTVRTLIEAGYEPQSVITAVTSGDLTLLKHTGYVSVQLQKPGEGGSSPAPPVPSSNGAASAAPDAASKALRRLARGKT